MRKNSHGLFRQLNIRLWLRRFHLALALLCGAVLAIVGVTGTLLVVQQPIAELEHGTAMFGTLSDTPALPIEKWAGAMAQGDPAKHKLWEIVAPHAAPLHNDRPMLLFGDLADPRVAVVDPQSARIIGDFALLDSISIFIYYLHSQLLLSDTGMTLVSVAAIGLILSLVTGLWLWWPRGRVLRALRPRQARGLAALLQWHNLVGVYAFVGLVLLGLSGIWLTRPAWIEPAISLISPVRDVRPTGARDDCASRLSYADVARVARTHAPGAEITYLGYVPDEGFEVYMRRPGDHNLRLGDTHFEIGLRCPAVIAIRPDGETAGEVLRQTMLPLHNGRILGLLGQVLVFAAGLALALSFVTGILLWLRRKGRERRAADTWNTRQMVETAQQ